MANENFKTFKALDSYIVFANTPDDKTLKQPLELLSVLAQQNSSFSNNISCHLITMLETPQESLPKRDPAQQQIPSFSFSAAAAIAANLRSPGHSATAHIFSNIISWGQCNQHKPP